MWSLYTWLECYGYFFKPFLLVPSILACIKYLCTKIKKKKKKFMKHGKKIRAQLKFNGFSLEKNRIDLMLL